VVLRARTVRRHCKTSSSFVYLVRWCKKFINKFKKDEYAEIKSKSRNPSVEVGNRIERAKGEEKTTEKTTTREEEKELSVSDNLTDVIPKEFSVSDKKIDGKVVVNFARRF
jgi:hypothetical protein